MLTFQTVASLDLAAASGLVVHGDDLLVVADDGNSIESFDRSGARRRSIPLGFASLPIEPRARKKIKPDLESLARLSTNEVVAFGSGSTERRMRAVCVELTTGRVRQADMAPLVAGIASHFAEPNLEGATFHGDTFVLAQRGNGRARGGGLVLLDARRAREALSQGVLDASLVRSFESLDLGDIDGVPLAFTDLCVDPDGTLWFAAAAEDVASTYADGPCVGSVVGRLDADYRVAALHRVPGTLKIEGLCFDSNDEGPRCGFMVADADDPSRPSPLLAFRVEGPA